jgi:hypothetical protein
MANDIPFDVPISPTLASMARRFGIGLSTLADEVLTQRILRDPVSALTGRMRVALLAAQDRPRIRPPPHGTEHVFSPFCLIPTQSLAS